MAFTVVDGKIAAINALADPDRLARLDLSAIWGASVSDAGTEVPQNNRLTRIFPRSGDPVSRRAAPAG